MSSIYGRLLRISNNGKTHYEYVCFRVSSTSIGTTRPHLPSPDSSVATFEPQKCTNDPLRAPKCHKMTPWRAEKTPRTAINDHSRARTGLGPSSPKDLPANPPTHQGSMPIAIPAGVAGDFAASVFNPANPQVPC